MIFDAEDVHYLQSGTIAPFKLNSNLRYRVVAVNGDAAKLLSGPCPCYWLDRKTRQPLTYKDGSEARWTTLDDAIDAFVEGRLEVEGNELLDSNLSYDGQPKTVIEQAAEQWMCNRTASGEE